MIGAGATIMGSLTLGEVKLTGVGIAAASNPEDGRR
jgi:hypothetical protein